MSTYIKLSTLEYPRHEGDIRIEHPEIQETQTGDTFPCPSTYALVVPTTAPAFDEATQIAQPQAPVQVNGVWTQQWVVRDLTAQELEAKALELAEIEKIRQEYESNQP
jgi:hypothetical protein